MKRISLTILALAVGVGTASAGTLQVDLTGGTNGAVTLSGGTTTGAIFDNNTSLQSVGTGTIDSFLRVQSNDTVEDGYNTDAKNPGIEDDVGGNFTHSLTIAGLDSTFKPGYYTFLLDINQTGSASLLSLDDLQLFYGTTGDVSTPTDTGPPTGVTKVFDFQDATSCSSVTSPAACTITGTRNELLLDYNLNSGSGKGFDMFFFVPTSVFNGVPATDFFYLYSKWGLVGGAYSNNDGFEEWARFNAGGQVPEPSYLAGLAVGAVLLFLVDRRRRQRLNNPA